MRSSILLALVFALLYPGRGFADHKEEIDSLLSRGHAEGKSCKKFTKKWKGVVRGGLNSASASHTDKAHALETLALLEKYPGRAPSMAKLWEYLVDHRDELASDPDQAGIADRIAKFEQQCEFFSHYTHLSILFRDVKAFSFAKKEKARVIKLARRYLLDEPSLVTLVSLGMKGTLLDTFLTELHEGGDKEALQARRKQYSRNVEAERIVAEEAREKLAPEKRSSLAFYSSELSAWKKLREEYLALAHDVFP